MGCVSAPTGQRIVIRPGNDWHDRAFHVTQREGGRLNAGEQEALRVNPLDAVDDLAFTFESDSFSAYIGGTRGILTKWEQLATVDHKSSPAR